MRQKIGCFGNFFSNYFIAGHEVRKNENDNHLGQRDLTLNEAMAVIGRRIGIPDLKYVQFSYEEAARGMMEMGISEDVSSLFVEMCDALNNGLFAVGRPRTPKNTTPTSIEEFAETFAVHFEAAALRQAA